MPKSRIPSPARSQGALLTPRRNPSRRTRSVGSPARSTASGRLSTIVDQFKDNNRESVALSPLNKTFLSDNTDIDMPRRKSWWKQVDNSRDVIAVLDNNDPADAVNVLEELDLELLSQEKKATQNYTLDLPESSGSESISSIVLPQRRLFTQKENVPQSKKFGQIISSIKSITKHNKSREDKLPKVGTKTLFGDAKRTKPDFPAALVNLSPDKTLANKTKDLAADVPVPGKSLFGNRHGIKRKNMFADFIVSESEDEIPEIQCKMFSFHKRDEAEPVRRSSANSKAVREPSPTTSLTTEMDIDDWKLLPSSTMVDHQIQTHLNTPGRRSMRFSKLSEAKESTNASSSRHSQDKGKAEENIPEKLEKNQKEIVIVNEEDDNESQEEIEGNNQGKIMQASYEANPKEDKQESNKKFEICNIEKDVGVRTEEVETDHLEDEVKKGQEREGVEEAMTNNQEDVEVSQEEAEADEQNNVEVSQEETNADEHQNVEVSQEENKANEKEDVEVSKEEAKVDEQEEVEVSQEEAEVDKQKYVEVSQEENKADEKEDVEASKEGAEADEQDEVEVSQEEAEFDNQEDVEVSQEEVNADNEEDVFEESENEVEADNLEYNAEEVQEGAELDQEENDAGDQDDNEETADDSDHDIEQSDNEEVAKDDRQEEEAFEVDDEVDDGDMTQEEQDTSNQNMNPSPETDENDLEQQESFNRHEVNASGDKESFNEQEDESQESDEQNESDDVRSQDESEDSEKEIAEDDQDEINETEISNIQDDGAESHEDEQDQNDHENEAQDHINAEISHDTTGRKRKRPETKSPEAILRDVSSDVNSFMAEGHNTSIRNTKSVIKNFTSRPSMAPVRQSTGLGDGTKNSSAEGSGWDSHRTTRKTMRQTFGRDFSPRKSLRALVMEKSAKRQTAIHEANAGLKLHQANSTEIPLENNDIDYDDHEDPVESDHELSRRTRQTTLETYLQKIKKENMERKQRIEKQVRDSLKSNVMQADILNFKVPTKPALKRVMPKKPTSKVKRMKLSIIARENLPPELLEDMKYKPPKRFRPNNAPWITSRLYKFLESKLEPKYDYKARVRAEKLVEMIYNFARDTRRLQTAPAHAVNELKIEMARLEIVQTHFEFYNFFNEYMPMEVKIKVVPDIINEIPMPREGLFTPILE